MTGQVDVDGGAHVRVGGGVVDQDVQRPERIEGGLDTRLGLVGLTGIGRERRRLTVDGGRRLVQRVLLAGGQHHPRPGVGQRRGRGPTDPLGCAGHECGPASEVDLHATSVDGADARPVLPRVLPMANRLGDETSPYLRQHRDNPVDWYAVGRRGLRAGPGRGQADPVVDRLLGVSLVPRHGPRVVRGRGHRRAHERALREREGRPRGTARRGRGLHGRGPGHDRAGRLADDRLPDARRVAVLRRDLLPQGRPPGHAVVHRSVSGDRRALPGEPHRGRRPGRAPHRGPRPQRRAHAGRRPAPGRGRRRGRRPSSSTTTTRRGAASGAPPSSPRR